MYRQYMYIVKYIRYMNMYICIYIYTYALFMPQNVFDHIGSDHVVGAI